MAKKHQNPHAHLEFNSRKLLKMLEKDGWVHKRTNGDHHTFRKIRGSASDRARPPKEGSAHRVGTKDLQGCWLENLRAGQERAMKTYIAYVYKDPNSSFGVSFPDLPGCYGAGETYDEAINSAKISLREYALAMADEGDDMPAPRTHGELAGDTAEAIEMRKCAFCIEVPLVVTVGQKRRVNLSLDGRMLDAIDRACAAAGMNRSAFLSNIAANWLQETIGAVIAPSNKRRRRQKLAIA